MKRRFAFTFAYCILALTLLGLTTTAAAPKKVLVVTVTTGFRHSSIETAERVLQKLGQESGVFTVDFARVTPPKGPRKPSPPKDGGDADKFKADQAKYEEALARYKEEETKFKEAQKAYASEQKNVLAEKMSLKALENYDGVIFANTTGDIPLPDREGFVAWVKAGHGFVGMHSASDTFHGFPPFIEMLGGEFQTHGAQATVDCLNQDQAHPACKHLPSSWTVHDEIYILKNFKRENVRGLLTLDKEPNKKTPGDFPIAWCKEFGKGKVFYTSLGHREDVWDTEEKNRRNSKEVAEAYQQHILGGIKWALGLEPGDAAPQSK